jgi:O-antigen biosynthesis protein
MENDLLHVGMISLDKVRRKLNHYFKSPVPHDKTDELNEYTVKEIKNIDFFEAKDALRPRLNLVVPSIEEEHIYGGISTSLALFQEISKYFERSRIVVIDFAVSESSLRCYPKYSLVDGDSDAAHQIVSTAETTQTSSELAVSKADVFIATIWYSAHIVRKIREWQCATYLSLPKSFVYLIQDYEPGFYPWSSQYLLADSTYRNNSETLAVFNTHNLQKYFHSKNIRFFQEYSFEPIMNSTLREERFRFQDHKKQKIIVVYGRPSTKRNAFCLIVDSLRHWHKIDPQSVNWKIISAGENHPEIIIGSDLSIKSVGKLGAKEYAELLGSASVGISLMVSPHPSYPPLEMAHYGMRVITNVYEGKDLSKVHSNITALEDMRCESVAHNLRKICRQVEEDPFHGWNARSFINGYLSQDSQFSFAEDLATQLLQRGESKEF